MGKKILVVDDDDALNDLIKVRLEQEGYSVIQAYDGIECVKLAKSDSPDLIILDIMMPQMDGYSAIKELRLDEKTKDISVIILTCKEKMQDLFNMENVKAYIVKPYDHKALLGEVARALK